MGRDLRHHLACEGEMGEEGREEAPSQTFAASEGEMGEDGRGAQGESGRKGGRKGRGEVVRERRGGKKRGEEGRGDERKGGWRATRHGKEIMESLISFFLKSEADPRRKSWRYINLH